MNAHLNLSHINGLLGDTRVPSARFEKGFIKVLAAELHETDDAIHLKLELPGLEAKDLDIQVTQDAVHIGGERKSETKTETNGTKSSEFYYGKFQRVIPLSARIQNTNVTADYKDSILNLTLPKSEQELRPKRSYAVGFTASSMTIVDIAKNQT